MVEYLFKKLCGLPPYDSKDLIEAKTWVPLEIVLDIELKLPVMDVYVEEKVKEIYAWANSPNNH